MDTDQTEAGSEADAKVAGARSPLSRGSMAHSVTGGRPAAAGVPAAASPARPHSARSLTCPSLTAGANAQLIWGPR